MHYKQKLWIQKGQTIDILIEALPFLLNQYLCMPDACFLFALSNINEISLLETPGFSHPQASKI